MPELAIQRHVALTLVLLAAAISCGPPREPGNSTVKSPAPATPHGGSPSQASAVVQPASSSEAAATGAETAGSSSAVRLPDTPAGHQLAAWLEAFNSGDGRALLAHHEQHFRYEAATRDAGSLQRQQGSSGATGGFEPRRIERSDSNGLVVLLQSRHDSHYARIALKVSPEPPHPVTRFRIRPIPTPLDLAPPAERAARTLDAEKRRAVLESIGQQLEAHYIFAETGTRVAAALKKKLDRGDYDQLSDAAEFADALSRDLRRLARDKHLRLRFGPMPPEQPKLDPDVKAHVGAAIEPIERLAGNVARLTIHGFPRLSESSLQALAERMSAIVDADAVIVDLRDNGGGFPPTEKLVVSYFFDREPVHLSTVYRRDTGETWKNWTEIDLPGRRYGSRKPVYVLTSPDTFSGGEAMAYQLQALGRAVVVGEGTGGGAHAGWPYPVEGGFVLRVPFMRSENPITGTDWESIGVVPDVDVPADEALETAHQLALEQLRRGETGRSSLESR